MWSSSDLKWLKENYPAVKKIAPHKLEGRVSFQMLRSNGQYFFSPSPTQIQQSTGPDYLYLCGSYEIRIERDQSKGFPISRETGGKLAAVAVKLGKDNKDMHLYPDGTLCLAAPMELDIEFDRGFKLETYIEKFLVPYLSAQTYYAKKQIWVWDDLSHGIWGLLEWLGRKKDYISDYALRTYIRLLIYAKQENGDVRAILSIRCRNHKPCPCGSNKKTSICHPDVQLGIARLRSAISSGLIDTSSKEDGSL